MNKLLFNLIRVIMIILVGVVLWIYTPKHSENKILPNKAVNMSVCEHNRRCYEACREDLLAVTALVEGFHNKPYFCGKKWTIGFGTTMYPNGEKVTKNDFPISLSYAKECVYNHYDTHVWPWIAKYVTRKLTPEQMIGTCSFIYNVGGESFSGHTKDGKVSQKPEKVKKGRKTKTIWVDVSPSSFLIAINSGKSGHETAIRMNGFRSSNGKLAKGLPKRHWIEGAVYQGLITTKDILSLEPKKFYEKRHGFDIDFYYKDCNGSYWTHDYSRKKVCEFLQKNSSDSVNVKTLIQPKNLVTMW